MTANHTHRNIFIPCTGLIDCDVEALGLTPTESGRIGFEYSNDIVRFLELDKCVSVEELLEVIWHTPGPTCSNTLVMSSHRPKHYVIPSASQHHSKTTP